MPEPISVLFVCLGNICRSTMSEGVFQSIANKEPYEGLVSKIDSCGTGEPSLDTIILLPSSHGHTPLTSEQAGYHIDEEPDHRTMATLRAKGIKDYAHLGRKVYFPLQTRVRIKLTHGASQLRSSDFDSFDYIFAMDKSNLSDVLREQRKKPGGSGSTRAKVMLFGEYSGTGQVEIVDDPYYGGHDGFETAYEQAERFSRNFLREVFPDVQG